jgi:hypothetical protein
MMGRSESRDCWRAILNTVDVKGMRREMSTGRGMGD